MLLTQLSHVFAEGFAEIWIVLVVHDCKVEQQSFTVVGMYANVVVYSPPNHSLMNSILQQSVLPFLRKYWWVWLSLFIVAVIVVIIGPSVVGGFIYRAFQFLLGAALIGLVFNTAYDYTFGRKMVEAWGWLRLVGFMVLAPGVYLFASSLLIVQKKIDGDWSLETGIRIGKLFFVEGIVVALSLLVIGVGELLLYLDKMKQMALPPKLEMICPRCVGKGFVDRDDIRRLGMTKEWWPGPCDYCNAQGYIERGKTKMEHPLMDLHDPIRQKWDNMTVEEVEAAYEEMKRRETSE